MSDERLRELERRWKETGSSEDEAAWLLERVRVGERLDWDSYTRLAEVNVEAATEFLLERVASGDLEPWEVKLAAFCAHEPARAALGNRAPEPPPTLWDWAARLGTHGWLWSARAALVAARLACDRVREVDEAHILVVEAVSVLLSNPNQTRFDEARRAWMSFLDAGGCSFGIPTDAPSTEHRELTSLNEIVFHLGNAAAIWGLGSDFPFPQPRTALPDTGTPPSAGQAKAVRTCLGKAHSLGIERDTIRTAIGESLVPRALRGGDHVRDSDEAREGKEPK